MSITIPDHVVFRQLGDETVLADLHQEEYFSLNEVGTRVWVMIESGKNFDSIVKTLTGEFDVDEETARQDVTALIDELAKAKLISMSP